MRQAGKQAGRQVGRQAGRQAQYGQIERRYVMVYTLNFYKAGK